MNQELTANYRGPQDSVHNHPPTVPACRETWVDDAPVGACLIRSVGPEGGAS